MKARQTAGKGVSRVPNAGTARTAKRLSQLLLVFVLIAMFGWVANAQADTGIATVYLSGAGSDANDGSSAATAVASFAKAKTLLAQSDGTIDVTGVVTVNGTETWDLGDHTNAVVLRDASYKGNLVSVTAGGNLTLSNIVIDGNKVAGATSLVQVSAGTLTMNTGAVLRNNTSTTSPGGVHLPLNGTGTFVMNDGRITGNSNTSTGQSTIGGGVGIFGGTFTMNGGSIDGNTGANGGGVGDRAIPISLLGGTITGNTATTGNGIYISSQTGIVTIGPDMTINDASYFNGSNIYLQISGAVKSNLNVTFGGTGATITENRLAVQAAGGYTITPADLKKFISGNTGWYFKLNTAGSQILWTATAPVWVTGVSLDKTTDAITVGQTDQLTANVAPTGATYTGVAWKSDDTSVATVSPTGQVTAVAPGTAHITATTSDGGYVDTCAVSVNAIDISGATIADILDQTYTGSAITPDPIVTLNATILGASNYTVGYSDNVSVGTATVTVTGTGNYTGSASKTFNIVKATQIVSVWPTAGPITFGQSLSASSLTGGTASVAGDFAFATPEIVPGSVGTYGASVTFTPTDTDNYSTVSTTVEVTVNAIDISQATIGAIADQTHTGAAITPDPVVTYDGKTLVKNTDYTVSYSGNTDVGQASVTITGTGNYSGTKSTTFNIVEPAPAITLIEKPTGKVEGGTTITIHGTGLSTVTAVKFGSQDAAWFTYVAASDTIQATSPAITLPAGASCRRVDVAVTSPSGTSATTAADEFLYYTLTVLNRSTTRTYSLTFVKTKAPATFTGFGGPKTGSAPYATSSYTGATLLDFFNDTGAISEGWTVVATGADGSQVTFTYDQMKNMTFNTYSPTDGSAVTGVSVRPVMAYNMDGKPIDYKTGPVRLVMLSADNSQVTTYGWLDGLVSLEAIPPTPVVSKITPASGALEGGDTVTISGTGLAEATAVKFGGVAAKSFTVNSATSITAVTPAHVAGKVDVAVTTIGGTSSTATTADDFTYLARVQQTDSRLIYTGSWSTYSNPVFSGGSYRYSAVAGSSVVIPFSGKQLDWTATTGPQYGIASISVDGGTARSVDLYAATVQYGQVVYSTGVLTDGMHTLKITYTGTKNTKSTGTYINVDALGVWGGLLGTSRFEQTSTKLVWAKTWTLGTSAYLSGGNFRYANVSGASVTINFTGVSLNLIAKKNYNMGKASISVDGGKATLVDLYSPSVLYKQLAFSTGILKPGNHTVKILWTGQRRTGATNTFINIDAVDIIGGLR